MLSDVVKVCRMDIFEGINIYFRNNPPQSILDDLGIYHDCEVPLPAKYVRNPCRCGTVHKWENPQTFILSEFESLPGKIIKRCITCKEVLLLELWKGCGFNEE